MIKLEYEKYGLPKLPFLFGFIFFAILVVEVFMEFFQHHHFGFKIVINGAVDSIITSIIIFPIIHLIFYKPAKTYIGKLDILREELIAAGKIQINSLPSDMESNEIIIKGIFSPFQYVSGDTYTFVWHSTTKELDGYVMDVMGHGMSTALQISALKMLFRRSYRPIHQEGSNLTHSVESLNRQCVNFFDEIHNGSFAATINFNLNLNTNLLTVVGSGIGEFILISEGVGEIKTVPGMFLGIVPTETFDQTIFPVKHGDTLIFASDGFLEIIRDNLETSFKSFNEAYNRLTEITKTQDVNDDCTAILINIK